MLTKHPRDGLEADDELGADRPCVLVLEQQVMQELEERLRLTAVELAGIVCEDEQLPTHDEALDLRPGGVELVDADQVRVGVHDLLDGARDRGPCLRGQALVPDVWEVQEDT